MSSSRRRMRYAGKKLVFFLLVAAVVAGLVLADRFGAFGRRPEGDVEKYDGRTFTVVRVVDGDTLNVNVPDGRHDSTHVRLWGVDTPETVKPNTPPQRFGREASEFTSRATLEKQVRLELDERDTRDKYGRLLAYVHLPDGRMLNRALIEEGLGYADPRFDHRCKDEFARLQRDAMKAGRGLWKDANADDLPYYLKGKIKLPGR